MSGPGEVDSRGCLARRVRPSSDGGCRPAPEPGRPLRRPIPRARTPSVPAAPANRCAWVSGTWAYISAVGVPPRTMSTWVRARVTPMQAGMPCTIAGLTASAERATRTATRASWMRPARTVMAQEARQSNWWMRSALIAVRPAAGPLPLSGDPPRRPATTPPTAAATSPTGSGAPVARAMSSESGRAIRNTLIEADRSAGAIRKPRPSGVGCSTVTVGAGVVRRTAQGREGAQAQRAGRSGRAGKIAGGHGSRFLRGGAVAECGCGRGSRREAAECSNARSRTRSQSQLSVKESS